MKNFFSSFFKFIGWTFLIVLLTFLSQTGGVILLVFLVIRNFLPKEPSKPRRMLRNWSIFLLMYGAFNFLIVPKIAERSGKVPLPVFSENLRPHRIAYALLNRHYVTENMRREITNAANEMSKKYPGTVTYYLDGSHPIGNPRLYPHLKHKGGRKLDVCFFYKNKNDEEKVEQNPSILGYGYFVKPKEGERDLPAECAQQGSWWYGFTGWFVFDGTGQNLEIDVEKNRFFLENLTNKKLVRRIFIEPHLKERFGMQGNEKIRFHGCWAVRHDDHLHMEVR